MSVRLYILEFVELSIPEKRVRPQASEKRKVFGFTLFLLSSHYVTRTFWFYLLCDVKEGDSDDDYYSVMKKSDHYYDVFLC